MSWLSSITRMRIGGSCLGMGAGGQRRARMRPDHVAAVPLQPRRKDSGTAAGADARACGQNKDPSEKPAWAKGIAPIDRVCTPCGGYHWRERRTSVQTDYAACD